MPSRVRALTIRAKDSAPSSCDRSVRTRPHLMIRTASTQVALADHDFADPLGEGRGARNVTGAGSCPGCWPICLARTAGRSPSTPATPVRTARNTCCPGLSGTRTGCRRSPATTSSTISPTRQAVLVIDETGDVKRERTRSGCSGSTAAALGGSRTPKSLRICHTPPAVGMLIDRKLYPPRSCTDDPNCARSPVCLPGPARHQAGALATEHMPLRTDVAAQLSVLGDPGAGAGGHLRRGLRVPYDRNVAHVRVAVYLRQSL